MAPSNKITPKDVKKKKLDYKDYSKARGPVKQKQDKPGASLERILKDDQYDFDTKYGPSKMGPVADRRGKVQAKLAAKRLKKPLAKGGK
jgi:hypothetical protein